MNRTAARGRAQGRSDKEATAMISPRATGSLALFACLNLAALPLAHAIVTLGDNVELEGFVNVQNGVRQPNFESADLIMQRNTAQVEGKYYFLKDSTAFGRFDTGRLEEATFTFVGRGVYDSAYDIRESWQDAYSRDGHHPGEVDFKLREAFVDLLLPPLSLRLGRQQVVWGGRRTTSARSTRSTRWT
jgi:hypothetical protein